MRMLIFFVAMAIFSHQACNDDKKANENAANQNAAVTTSDPLSQIMEKKMMLDSITGKTYEAQRPINPISSAISENPVSIIDEVKPIPTAPTATSPQQERIIRVLTKDYWIVWVLSKIGHKELNRVNQGAWFKFNPDGTYKYGDFEKTISSGAWTWDYKDKKGVLLLDSELLGDDREWTFLMGSDEDVMIWVGTERYHTTDIQCKLQNLIQPPRNRHEMGFEN